MQQPLRFLSAPSTVLLALLTASCGSEVEAPPSTTQGTGGAGTTSSDSSSSTSTGFGGGGGDATCGSCPLGETCINGQCAPAAGTLLLSFVETKTMDIDGKEAYGADAALCGYDTSAGWPELPGRNGACVLVPGNTNPDDPPPLGGTGSVLIDAANVGNVAIAAPDADVACRKQSLQDTGYLVGGTYVGFSGEGGAIFPPFDVDVRIPAALQLGAGALERGNPFTIDWTGTGDAPLFLVIGTLGTLEDPYLVCEVDDTGELVVEGALTDLLADAPAPGFVFGARTETVSTSPQGPYEVRALVQRTDLLIVDYTPF